MGHVSLDITIKGSKGKKSIKGLLVDTGATYTVLPRDELEGVQTLESLGLRIDPNKRRLEPTRPRGIAYFY